MTPARLVAAEPTSRPAVQRHHGRSGSRSWLTALAVGAAAFAVLVAVIPEVFIPDTNLGWVDAWYYVSLGLKLPARVAQYRLLYQSERIGWTLPAYAFNRIAPLLVANYLVKATFFIGAVMFLFGIVRDMTGSTRTAAFASSLAALHSFFVHTFGTSYVDGPMLTYILGSLYFGQRALSMTPRVGSAFIAGVFLGAQLLTHFVCLFLLPAVAVFAALTARSGRLSARRCWFAGGALLSGTAVVLAGADLLYVHWGIGNAPLRESIAVLFDHAVADLVRPSNARWVWHAMWLAWPTTVTVWAMFVIASTARLRTPLSAMLHLPPAWWLVVVSFASWVALYLAGAPWLMLPFYSSYLIPFAFIALGWAVAPAIAQLSTTLFGLLLACTFLLSGVGYRLSRVVDTAAAAKIALVCLGVATLLRTRDRWQSSSAFPLLLVGALTFTNGATSDFGPQLWHGYAQTGMSTIYGPDNPGQLSTVPRSVRFEAAVGAADRLSFLLSGNSGRPYFFWYYSREELGGFFRSVTSFMFAWSTSNMLGEDYHRFDADNRRTLSAYDESGMRDLVVLSECSTITPPDARYTLQWTQSDAVGGIPFFVHYLAFGGKVDAAEHR